jgi:hypothetical protein
MLASREQIYQALFDKISSITDFVVAERRLVKPESVTAEDMPALFMIQANETSEAQKQLHGTPIKREMTVHVEMYVRSPDPVIDKDTGISTLTYPCSIMNPLVDKLDNILLPIPGNPRQTLGGLVEWVYVGEVKYYNHPTANQMMLTVPITMLWFQA